MALEQQAVPVQRREPDHAGKRLGGHRDPDRGADQRAAREQVREGGLDQLDGDPAREYVLDGGLVHRLDRSVGEGLRVEHLISQVERDAADQRGQRSHDHQSGAHAAPNTASFGPVAQTLSPPGDRRMCTI